MSPTDSPEPQVPASPEPRRLLSIRYGAALQFAAELHAWQARKGASIPYISHLLAVSSLVLESGGDEDTAIAALLHDAIEDQVDDYPGDLRRYIRDTFGERVLEIVEHCSDSATSREKPAWRIRKEAYIARLRSTTDTAALLVSSADKLHNARSILADYREIGDKVWARFTAKKEETLWYYRQLADVFQARAPGRLAEELMGVMAELEKVSGASSNYQRAHANLRTC